MRSHRNLPKGYQQILHIDLQKDKKQALIVNGLALVIMVVMLVPALLLVPLNTLFRYNYNNTGAMLVRVAVMLVGYVAYMVLHEATHGIAMRHYCNQKVKFGFTGMYAFAGSEAYYCRKHYAVIAMAPLVVWGIVLLFLNLVVPMSWFYVVYFIQVGNVSGAAGDMYVTWRMRRLPRDILVRDSGVSMTVFSRRKGTEEMNGR